MLELLSGTPESQAAVLPLTARLRTLRNALLTGLVERDTSIRLALLAALTGEHLLLIGPPGTAKSVLARRLRLAFKDASYFERLLTRFTVPEELFGPLSIKALEQDVYERQTDRYLPTAAVAFLDEIFKANSAILNALLTLLNEREFDNGTRRLKTPLLSVVGASNELPRGEELDALFDRFLLRLHLGYVSEEGFSTLLELRGEAIPEVTAEHWITAEELRELQAAADRVAVPPDVVALLQACRKWCAEQSIAVSDRRWRKIVKLLQMSALTNGRSEVSVWDAWLLQHCLWTEPEQRALVYDWYAARVGASAALDPSQVTRVVVSWEARLSRELSSQGQQRDAKGRLLYVGADGKHTSDAKAVVQSEREGKPLYLAQSDWGYHPHYTPPSKDVCRRGFTEAELAKWSIAGDWFSDWPGRAAYLAAPANWVTTEEVHPAAMGITQQKPAHVASMLEQLDSATQNIETYRALVVNHLSSLTGTITSHLWVTPDFVQPALTTLQATLTTVESLAARLAAVRVGFTKLPVEPAAELDDGAP